MQRRPSRTSAQKLRHLLPVVFFLAILYVLATHDYLLPLLFIVGYIIVRLVIKQDWVYETIDLILAYFRRSRPTTPYYQPSQERDIPEQPLYERGYREQPSQQQPQPSKNLPSETGPSAAYQEQPQAHYPESPLM